MTVEQVIQEINEEIKYNGQKLITGEKLNKVLNDVVETTSDYDESLNKPQINGIPLQGNKTYEDLRLQERIVSGKANLYDPYAADVIDGKYMLQNENGFNYFTNPDYKVSGFIPVIPGITYTAWHAHDRAYFDSNKNYINNSCITCV